MVPTVERGLRLVVFCSMEMAGLRPSTVSTSGRSSWSRNWRANGKVHGQESSWQGPRRLRLFLAGILIGECRRGFRGLGAIGSEFAPADGGKTMVRSDEDIGGCLDRGVRVEPVEQLLQTVIGILQSAPRGLAVDPRGKLLQAVALVVLRAVRIAGPEEQHEWVVVPAQS